MLSNKGHYKDMKISVAVGWNNSLCRQQCLLFVCNRWSQSGDFEYLIEGGGEWVNEGIVTYHPATSSHPPSHWGCTAHAKDERELYTLVVVREKADFCSNNWVIVCNRALRVKIWAQFCLKYGWSRRNHSNWVWEVFQCRMSKCDMSMMQILTDQSECLLRGLHDWCLSN